MTPAVLGDALQVAAVAQVRVVDADIADGGALSIKSTPTLFMRWPYLAVPMDPLVAALNRPCRIDCTRPVTWSPLAKVNASCAPAVAAAEKHVEGVPQVRPPITAVCPSSTMTRVSASLVLMMTPPCTVLCVARSLTSGCRSMMIFLSCVRCGVTRS